MLNMYASVDVGRMGIMMVFAGFPDANEMLKMLQTLLMKPVHRNM